MERVGRKEGERGREGGGVEVEWGVEWRWGRNEVGSGGMQEGSVRVSRFGEVGFGWDRGGSEGDVGTLILTILHSFTLAPPVKQQLANQ